VNNTETQYLPIETAEDFSRRSFRKCGLSQEDAALLADTLIQSELRGIGSHGLIRLPFYCQRLLDGGSNSNPDVKILSERPSLILVDGDNGLGQVVSVMTMRMVIERTASQGICFAGVRNSGHFGMTAYFPMMALKQNMIGLAGSNTAPVMAAWNGGKSAIGNNPLAIAVPTGKPYPLVLDMAMSVVSGGKVRLEALKGTKIPPNWILDSQGRPTDNPADFFPHGTLLPLGHKGFGLAIMIEILAGVLSRAAILKDIELWFDKTATPTNVGHFFMALDIGFFLDISDFRTRVDGLIDQLKGSPLAAGADEIFMPGELEYLTEQRCRQTGIPLAPAVIKTLDNFAQKIGIAGISC
jgi:LDH2 family malate/lactate/ureidoglycolate dehydrogenase